MKKVKKKHPLGKAEFKNEISNDKKVKERYSDVDFALDIFFVDKEAARTPISLLEDKKADLVILDLRTSSRPDSRVCRKKNFMPVWNCF